MDNSKKNVIDVNNISDEFTSLERRFLLLERRLYGLALHYSHYVDNTFSNDRLYELRDNVIYRLFSSRFHIQLLLQQQNLIKNKCLKMLNEGKLDLIQGIGPVHPIHDHFKKEISSIFDSLLYHIVSTFDFTSSLINYIYAEKKEKQNSIKWTSLSKIARDNQNHLFPLNISNAIIIHDNQFVSKLYDYRSHIIHDKGDLNNFGCNLNLNLTGFGNSTLRIIFTASQKFIKNFSSLRKIANNELLSTSYVSFWLLNSAIDHITDLLFEIKNDLELIENPPGGLLVIKDSVTNEVIPASIPYWQVEEYYESKKNRNK